IFFFSSRRRHTRSKRDWSSDVCSSDLGAVGALDLAREEVAQLEHAARGVHVLAGGDARDSRLVHPDRFGDVLENHRPHVLLAVLEERRLPPDDRAGDLQKGFVAETDALKVPPSARQRCAHGDTTQPCVAVYTRTIAGAM